MPLNKLILRKNNSHRSAPHAFHNRKILKLYRNLTLVFYGLYALILIKGLYVPLYSEASIIQTEKQQEINQNKGYQRWKKLQESFPVRKDALKLQHQFSFPKIVQEKRGIFLNIPACLCSDSKGSIFVSDRGNHNIIKFDSKGNYLKKIGSGGQAPGEFIVPRFIDTDHQDNLIIYDIGNSRIQILNSEGEFQKSFKTFRSYYSMAIDKQGLIYLSPFTKNLNEPLIEVFNMNGKLIKAFGQRIKFKPNYSVHNGILMSINNKGEIFVAWEYFPIVRNYSKEGKLLKEYRINYNLMKKLAEPNYKAKLTKSKIRMSSVITDIIAKDYKFYLFIRYPRIEIIEFNLKGKIVNIYWKNHPNNFLAADFLVNEYGQNKSKLFYILNFYPKQQISVYSINE